ncbi:DUF1214 domain-containing protein [Sphingopyxis sp. PET50]|uniref:DUF1214 domain-containing protein n=1 Tax=Sphingopyxis sp. PET50 TaxID=2976533 RepID=UPI0021AF8B2B|nr:DUF1214 domain-containing protein [Sphingopyxis sp. PET50]
MSTGPAVPMEWERFIHLISGIDRSLEHVIDPADPWLKQEAIQQMAMSLSQAYAPIMAQDSRVPGFYSFLNPVIKSAAPNPDYMYRSTFVEGGGTYRLSGWRGTTLFLHIGIGSGYIGVDDKPGPSVGHIDADTLTLDDAGRFSVILSAERPDGHDGDWYPLPANARTIGIREASYDWENEIDSRIAIERLDDTGGFTRPTIDEIAYRMERLAGFPERYAQLFVHFVNTVVLNTWSDIGGLAEQTYYEGLFEFSEGEALILETDVPDTVRYWAVLLADQLFNTIDWEKCQSSLNGFQARRDGDGKFRAVISVADPGVPNWLDTMRPLQGRGAGPLVSGELGAHADAETREARRAARPSARRHSACRPCGAPRKPARALSRRAVPAQMVIAALSSGLAACQLGVVVSDLDAGMDHYSRLLGLTGWKRMDTDYVARSREGGSPSPVGAISNRQEMGPHLRGDTRLLDTTPI